MRIVIPSFLDLLDQTSSDHFKEDDPRPGIETLLGSCVIRLVILVRYSTRPLAIRPDP